VIPHGVEVFVALDPVDLRWGFERLAGVVSEKVGRDARGGALFVFFGKRRHAIKVLFFDGTGMCLFYKRLDRGAFRIPAAPREGATALAIEERALDDLLDGIDLDTAAPAVPRRRSTTH
jgi:transposase